MKRLGVGSEIKPKKYEPGWSGETRGGYAPALAKPGSTKNFGTYTAENCPREGCTGKVVYNGNYFCEFWGFRGDGVPLEEGECDWAMSHPQMNHEDRLLSWNLTRAWECELPESWHEHTTKPIEGERCMITWPIPGGIVRNKKNIRGPQAESGEQAK